MSALSAYEWAVVAVGFMMGASIGSFLNVVVYRVPNGMSVVNPPSACPECGVRIHAYDNIPILSWVFLRARCRSCGTHISAQYVVIEAAVGVFGGVVTSLIVFHPDNMIQDLEISAAVIVLGLAGLVPLISGIRRKGRDDNDVRSVIASEAGRSPRRKA